jgi:hypothetical protein
MLFLPVLDEFYDDIYRTYGDYVNTLDNFIKPNSGLKYIRDYVLNNYTLNEYWKEGYDCCKIVLAEYNGQHNGVWFEIMYHMYLYCLYYKRDELDSFLKIFKQYMLSNSALKKEFDDRRDFYKQQFSYNTDIMNDI